MILKMDIGNRNPSHVVCASHVSVLDILPVHQHVVPAQCPHLALAYHHVALKHLAAISVHLWGRNGVDAVVWKARNRLQAADVCQVYVLSSLHPVLALAQMCKPLVGKQVFLSRKLGQIDSIGLFQSLLLDLLLSAAALSRFC